MPEDQVKEKQTQGQEDSANAETKKPDETQGQDQDHDAQSQQAEDPILELAKKIGYNPDYTGDEREFLTPEQFILKSKEIQKTASDHIKKQGRDIAELKNNFSAYKKHLDALYKAQMSNLKAEIASLKTRRRQADADGDHDLARELDNQINELNKTPQELPEAGTEIHPDFIAWVDDNGWYEKDNELRAYADMLGEQPEYRALGQRSYRNMLDKIEESVKKMFPQKFGRTQRLPSQPATPSKPPAATVENATPRKKPSGPKYTYADLSREQQDLADFYEKQGIMTRDQYIEELAKIAEAQQ